MFYVEIVDRETDKVEERVGPMDSTAASQVKRGASINLNHDGYYIRIVPAEGEE